MLTKPDELGVCCAKLSTGELLSWAEAVNYFQDGGVSLSCNNPLNAYSMRILLDYMLLARGPELLFLMGDTK